MINQLAIRETPAIGEFVHSVLDSIDKYARNISYYFVKIIWLPGEILDFVSNLPGEISYYLFKNITDGFWRASSSMNQMINFSEAFRIKAELQCAEDLWVNKVMSLKAEVR